MNVVDNVGTSVLGLAIKVGWLEAVELLVGAGAAIDEPSTEGDNNTPLLGTRSVTW